jgi:hypothetical protein
VPIEIPEIRQQGKGIDRTWQWRFQDGKWRDLNQDLAREEIKTYRARTEPYSAWEAFWRNVIPGQQQTEIEEIELGEIVDFDALIEKTDILPDYLKGSISAPYMLTLGGLWAEVTGYDPATGDYAPGESWNYDTRQGPDREVATEKEITNALQDITSELSDTYGWDRVSRTRDYNIDWSQDSAEGISPEALFISQSQDDVEHGKRYTGMDSRADIKGGGPAELPGDARYTGQPEATTMPEAGGVTASGRKVVATVSSESQATMMVGQIAGATIEQSDGKFLITVPPGQGGWGTEAGGQQWLDETGLGASGNFEMAPGKEGQWYVREKAADTATQQTFKTKAEAERWLTETGGFAPVEGEGGGKIAPEGYEVVATPEGNWVVREKAKDPLKPEYSTDTQAGDMFKPTITEDPTGRQFGLDAGGGITDLGYGMAGDITQQELAGYQVPHRSLPMIVAKAIEQGNWELARGVQAFIDSPTERDLLDYAAQYAEAPADLAVLSAIARGEQMVQPGVPLGEGMGTGMGQATRIGPPGEVYTSAYKSFVDSMNQGYVPNEDELRDLFDPKNDPAYIATKELSDKYETEIGNLRNQIAEANKLSSERIEKTQTNTMNMMTGMFENTIKSFQDLMKENTGMKDSEIAGLQAALDDARLGKDDNVYERQIAAGAGGLTSIQNEVNAAKAEWTKNNPGLQLNEMPGFAEAFKGGGEEKFLAWLQGNPQPVTVTPTPTPTATAVSTVTPAATTVAATGLGQFGRKVPTSADISSQTTGGFDFPAESIDPGIFENIVSGGTFTEGGKGAPATYKYSAPEVASRAKFAGAFDKAPDPTFGIRYATVPGEEMAEGGVVQGPTMALLGEKEPEFIVPFSKVDEFRRGQLPLGEPRQSQMGGAVANFEDSIPRFANGGMVTGPGERNIRFGGVTAGGLEQYGETGAYVTPETRTELELGAEGIYGAEGIGRAPRIASADFQSLMERYPDDPRVDYGFQEAGQIGGGGNIPEYELRQRLGASEYAGTNPAQHPIGIQQLMAGRPMGRPRSLMTAANMPIPSGQALRNMLPSEMAYYQKMGRLAGIPQEELGREMRSAMPGGTRRTPLSMRARRVRQA